MLTNGTAKEVTKGVKIHSEVEPLHLELSHEPLDAGEGDGKKADKPYWNQKYGEADEKMI